MAKKRLMISVAGIRGVVGETILPDEYLKYVMAFSSSLPGDVVVVGGDSRKSRTMMQHIAFSGLIATGKKILDIGICPTPTVGLLVKELGAAGGIAITASHNPREWNAYKFFSHKGIFLNKEEFNEIMESYKTAQFKLADIDGIGAVEKKDDAFDMHLKKVYDFSDIEKIKSKKLKVVVDCCNAAASEIVPRMLEELNCEAVIINNDVTKDFPHVPEPLPENITELCAKVKEVGADVGFAIDPDADRCAIVDETGTPIGEERTVALGSNYVLSYKKQGPIVVNLSTSRAVEDIAQKHGVEVFRTPIGEAHVAKKMLEVGSAIGGEGNGGIMNPGVHPCRDATGGICLILEMLAETGKTISELNKEIPNYVMIKKKYDMDLEKYPKIVEAAKEKLSRAKLDDIDGVKFSLEDSWIHLRPSGTEPILRLFAEAPDQDKCQSLINEVESLIK